MDEPSDAANPHGGPSPRADARELLLAGADLLVDEPQAVPLVTLAVLQALVAGDDVVYATDHPSQAITDLLSNLLELSPPEPEPPGWPALSHLSAAAALGSPVAANGRRRTLLLLGEGAAPDAVLSAAGASDPLLAWAHAEAVRRHRPGCTDLCSGASQRRERVAVVPAWLHPAEALVRVLTSLRLDHALIRVPDDVDIWLDHLRTAGLDARHVDDRRPDPAALLLTAAAHPPSGPPGEVPVVVLVGPTERAVEQAFSDAATGRFDGLGLVRLLGALDPMPSGVRRLTVADDETARHDMVAWRLDMLRLAGGSDHGWVDMVDAVLGVEGGRALMASALHELVRADHRHRHPPRPETIEAPPTLAPGAGRRRRRRRAGPTG